MSAAQHAVAEDPHDGQALFEREWATYHKLVNNNYLFQREAYDRLS